MKKMLFLVLISVCIVAYSQPKVSLAIMDFEPKGSEKSEASIIGDLFRDFIFETRKFVVVDRASMEAILVEQNLQQALGCTSEECAVQVGKILGVNYTIIGTLGKLGNVYIVSVRMVNIENAKIEWTKSERVNSFEQIDFLIRNLVSDLVKTVFHEEVAIQPTPTPTPTPTYTPPPTPTPTPTYTPTTPAPQYYPQMAKRGPDLGIDLSMGGFPIARSNYSFEMLDMEDHWYELIGKPSHFNFQLGFYWELLYFGMDISTLSHSEGDSVVYEDSYSAIDQIWNVNNSYSIVDLLLSARLAGRHGSTLFYLLWRSFSYSTETSDTSWDLNGPGMGFKFRIGSPFMDNPNSLPIGILFELGISGSYMIWDKPDYYSDDLSHFGIGVASNIGVGLILKKYGAYFLVSYYWKGFFNWYEYYDGFSYSNETENVELMGLRITFGFDFNLGAFAQ